MGLAELKESHPALYAAVFESGVQDGVIRERLRIAETKTANDLKSEPAAYAAGVKEGARAERERISAKLKSLDFKRILDGVQQSKNTRPKAKAIRPVTRL